MEEEVGSEVPKEFRFKGNPWARRAYYRNEILKLLVSNPETSFNANEVSEKVECNP